MAKYLVGAHYEYHGWIEVEADSPEEAVDKAQSMTYGQIKEAIMKNGPSVDVDVDDEAELDTSDEETDG